MREQSGQATTEYILLLAVVVSLFSLVMSQLQNFDLAKHFSDFLSKSFVGAYQYGKPGATGYDDGGPTNHPRAPDGNGDIRIFFVTKQ
jgi:hypothetical protein